MKRGSSSKLNCCIWSAFLREFCTKLMQQIGFFLFYERKYFHFCIEIMGRKYTTHLSFKTVLSLSAAFYPFYLRSISPEKYLPIRFSLKVYKLTKGILCNIDTFNDICSKIIVFYSSFRTN